MLKKLLQQKKELSLVEEVSKEGKKRIWRGVMDHPELSLAPPRLLVVESSNSSSSAESDAINCRKRKFCWDHSKSEPMIQTSIELQLKDPLPLDWEQCLDLQSGRMYYLNRNTLKKSWNRPKDQKLDLELNMSTVSGSDGKSSNKMIEDAKKHNNSSNTMVAVACFKCHLLVMLSKSSPSCPNCKYVHSLPPTQQSLLPKVATQKSLETLSLLN